MVDFIEFADPKLNSLNSPELLKKHLDETGGIVVTRFPPEPNAHLHLGHAKAMILSYSYADRKKGICYQRFDDTNPETSKQEYVDGILKMIDWIGLVPHKVTYTSDYFDKLFEYAKDLIKKNKAYVCSLSPTEILECKKLKQAPRCREKSIEQNLMEFVDMANGKYKEGEVCLRLKQDYLSDNPNMWDLVAYRIKYKSHYRTDKKWSIYPSYDFAHPICDSIENITHSFCSLEFETKRESYYWLLDQLNLYKPFVWEFSRLKLENTVMSKRKLLDLLSCNFVSGWDDPRLPTLLGMKRRGYTPQIIKEFCNNIGITRNNSLITNELLENISRNILDKTAPRYFAVKNPILIKIINMSDDHNVTITRPSFPNKNDTDYRNISFGPKLYIERSDYKYTDVKKFYGLAYQTYNNLPKWVKLKYVNVNIKVNEVLNDGQIYCEYDPLIKKTKTAIGWIDFSDAVSVEFRCFDNLLKKSDNNNESILNEKSINIYKGFGESGLKKLKIGDIVQFERLGYFCKDEESSDDLIVMNEIVSIKSKYQ